MNQTHKRVVLLMLNMLVVLLAMGWIFAPKAMAEDSNQTAATSDVSTLGIKTLDELPGKKIGLLNGSSFDQLIEKSIKGVDQKDFLYYNSNAELVGALQAHKADVMVTDSPIGQLVVNKNKDLGIVPEYIAEDHYGYVLEKDSALTAKLDALLTSYHADGTIDKLVEKWTGSEDTSKDMPAQDWAATNGTWVVATSIDNEPINYMVNNQVCGLSIELLELMARDLGYGVEYRTTNAGSLIAEVQSGKADIAAASFSITEERKKMVDMTVPFYDGGVTVVARKEGGAAATGEGFFEGLAASFERTFVTEGRWKLVLSGLGVTLLISASSGAAGLAAGFLLVLARRRREGGLADRAIRLFEGLMGGLPVVVVLMVLYYVVFGSSHVSGIVVAILAFTLLFGASSGSIMWNAIRAVDPGQAEAGRALGFGDRDTFFLVVLPQAARQFAPLLIAQFVSLVKDSSVVGYIAVQDLTRAGDLIRARTMEAFFPLIAVAVIYFALCRLMAWALGLLARRLEPKEGPRTIKGVDL